MLLSLVYLDSHPRPFTPSPGRRFRPGRKGLPSLQSAFPVLLHCRPIAAAYCFKSFSCNTYDLCASVANKGLTSWLSLLDATLTKSRGGTSNDVRTFRPARVPACHCSDAFLLALCFHAVTNCKFHNSFVLTFIQNAGGCTPLFLPFPTFGRSKLQTFRRVSASPIAGRSPWCNNWQRHEIHHRQGETYCPQPVSKHSERTSGTVRLRSRSKTPIRSGSQVVPGSTVLIVDRSAGWPEPASDARMRHVFRVGKAGSVRLG
jgi:hypothetical protein